MELNLATDRHPETKYKRSNIVLSVTSVALSVGNLGARLLELSVQSLIGSPGTLGGITLKISPQWSFV